MIVFRADAGPTIGAGHVMRCLALASAFAECGWCVGFAATADTSSAVAAFQAAPVEYLHLPDLPEEEPAALARRWPGGAELLVVDHYGRDASFEGACRPWARRIVVIDDLADRSHDADVLVDAGASSAAAYRNLVSKDCRILVGPNYALVNMRFRQARERALARRDGRAIDRILISFGQVDMPNGTMHALEAFSRINFDGEIDVVLGHTGPHLAAVRETARKDLRVHVDVADMAELMTEADLAIGGGGQTSWERCCLGLPSIVITMAKNQESVVARLAEAGAAMAIGPVGAGLKERIAATLNDLLLENDRPRTMARKAASLVDGRGTERIMLAALGSETTARGHAIRLRLAEAKDEDWILALQRMPEIRRYSQNPAVPKADEHARWFAATLASQDRLLSIVEANGKPVGTLRLDRMIGDGTYPRFEVSIAIDPEFQHANVGFTALMLLRKHCSNAELHSTILAANAPSIALFQRAGYHRVSMYRYCSYPA